MIDEKLKTSIVKQAYKVHKKILGQETRSAYLYGYSKGYYDRSVGREPRHNKQEPNHLTKGN